VIEQKLITLAGSAIVIAFMVGVSALLGFRKRLKLVEADARARIEAHEYGHRVADIAICDHGHAALARLEDGRWVVLNVIGDGVSARSFAAGALKLEKTRAGVRARFAELGFPTLNMSLKQPPAWLAAGGGDAP
jgi:hypothetical protein